MSKPKSQSPSRATTDAPQATSPTGCLVRLGWMLAGNVALVLCAASIAQRKALLSVADALFWASAALVVALRYIDVKSLNGRTSTGQPATMAHWRRYAVFMALVAVGVWLLAHGIARITA